MSVNRLYQLHVDAVKEFESGHQFNWIFKFECDAVDLPALELTDVRDEAEKWRSEITPKELYFSHAQFYTDGIKHIISELNAKPTSNRALYSLIAQEHIRRSGDNPIPSFMTLQCQIDKDVLYCTCYFRALEVSKFLKINLEEIRQTLVEIHNGVPHFLKVCLTIFAFHAYADPKLSSLRRPRLESLHDDDLVALLITPSLNPIRTLSDLLKELNGALTVVSPEKLESLKRILSNKCFDKMIDLGLKKPLLINQIEGAIVATTKLAELRRKVSRGASIDAATKIYQEAIIALCANLDA